MGHADRTDMPRVYLSRHVKPARPLDIKTGAQHRILCGSGDPRGRLEALRDTHFHQIVIRGMIVDAIAAHPIAVVRYQFRPVRIGDAAPLNDFSATRHQAKSREPFSRLTRSFARHCFLKCHVRREQIDVLERRAFAAG